MAFHLVGRATNGETGSVPEGPPNHEHGTNFTKLRCKIKRPSYEVPIFPHRGFTFFSLRLSANVVVEQTPDERQDSETR